MASYLQRLVDRATGVPASTIARAPQPDAPLVDPFEAPPIAMPRSEAPSVAHEAHAPASIQRVVEAAAPLPSQVTEHEHTHEVIRERHHHEVAGPHVLREVATELRAPAVEPPAPIMPSSDRERVIEQATHTDEIVERLETDRATLRETHTREVVHAATPITPPLPTIEAPRTPSLPAPQIASVRPIVPEPPPMPPPVAAPVPAPRLVIGRVTVEVIPPSPPAPVQNRTIVVAAPRSDVRPDLVRRTFGLDQG